MMESHYKQNPKIPCRDLTENLKSNCKGHLKSKCKGDEHRELKGTLWYISKSKCKGKLKRKI